MADLPELRWVLSSSVIQGDFACDVPGCDSLETWTLVANHCVDYPLLELCEQHQRLFHDAERSPVPFLRVVPQINVMGHLNREQKLELLRQAAETPEVSGGYGGEDK